MRAHTRLRAATSLLKPLQPSVTRSAPASSICRACLSQRLYSSSSSSSPSSSGLAPLLSRRIISISGPDATKYLQGVITSSVHTPSGGPRTDGFYSAFLSAQGRVLHDVIVYPDSSKPAGEGFLIEVDADEAGRLERHIKRYKLRAKFAVRLVDVGEMGVWAAWGEGVAVKRVQGEMAMVDPRCPALGWRMITGRERPEVDLEKVEERQYTVRRYLAGIPEGQKEILREQALPLESNMDIMGGIDFRKGCYVGQELTIRTKHRGVVRKRILPCIIYPEDRPAPQELVYSPDSLAAQGGFRSAEEIPIETSIGRVEMKGRSAGKWLAGIGNVGLALCRLEVMTDMVLPGEVSAGTGFSPTDEFVLTEKLEGDGVGRKVKVKAFVPTWLRQGLQQGGHS